MAILLSRRRPNIMPTPQNVAPKWRPLWGGLMVAVPFWEGAGRPKDLLSGQQTQALPTGWDWRNTPYGIGLHVDGTGASRTNIYFPIRFGTPVALPFTMACCFYNLQAPGASSGMCGIVSGAGGQGFMLMSEIWNNTGFFGLTKMGVADISSGLSNVVPGFGCIAVSADSTEELHALNNGGVLSIARTTNGTAVGAGATHVEIGNGDRFNNQSDTTDATFLAVYVWRRKLLRTELLQVVSDPFGLLEVMPSTRYKAGAAAGPSIPPGLLGGHLIGTGPLIGPSGLISLGV